VPEVRGSVVRCCSGFTKAISSTLAQCSESAAVRRDGTCDHRQLSKLPRIIVVETQHSAPAVDSALVANSATTTPRRLHCSSRIGVAISTRITGEITNPRATTSRVCRSRSRPTTDIKASLDETEARICQSGFDAADGGECCDLQRLVAQLESRGSRIYFLECLFPATSAKRIMRSPRGHWRTKGGPDRSQWLIQLSCVRVALVDRVAHGRAVRHPSWRRRCGRLSQAA